MVVIPLSSALVRTHPDTVSSLRHWQTGVRSVRSPGLSGLEHWPWEEKPQEQGLASLAQERLWRDSQKPPCLGGNEKMWPGPSQRCHNLVGRQCFMVGLSGNYVLQGSDLRVCHSTNIAGGGSLLWGIKLEPFIQICTQLVILVDQTQSGI